MSTFTDNQFYEEARKLREEMDKRLRGLDENTKARKAIEDEIAQRKAESVKAAHADNERKRTQDLDTITRALINAGASPEEASELALRVRANRLQRDAERDQELPPEYRF